MRKFGLLVCFLLLYTVLPALAQDAAPSVDPVDLADADGKFMTINDTSIYYLDRGPVDGEPVILLHGFLGSVIDWTRTIPALTDAGYRVIAFDRPPFGLSDKRTSLDYSLQAMSALTAGVMDTLEMNQAVIIGHSLGGAVASQFVLDYPTRVSKLILVDAAVGLDMSGNAGNFGIDFLSRVNPDSPAAQALVQSIFNPDFATNMLTQAEANARDIDAEELELRVRGLRVKGWEGGLLAFTRDALTEKSQIDLEALKTVQKPVLLMWGEDDQIVPIEVGEALRELFPHNTWLTYPEVGHMPMDEITSQFNADLLAFIAAAPV